MFVSWLGPTLIVELNQTWLPQRLSALKNIKGEVAAPLSQNILVALFFFVHKAGYFEFRPHNLVSLAHILSHEEKQAKSIGNESSVQTVTFLAI